MKIRSSVKYVIWTLVAVYAALLLVYGIYFFFQPHNATYSMRDFLGMDPTPEKVAQNLCRALQDGNTAAFRTCCSADSLNRFLLFKNVVLDDEVAVEYTISDYVAGRQAQLKHCEFEIEKAVHRRQENRDVATVMVHVMKDGKVIYDRNLHFIRNDVSHQWECTEKLF